jgi:LacI family transcriptional regulator
MRERSVEKKRRRAVKLPGSLNSVTTSDVARLAEVSTATVSRTLNSPSIVRPEVRERVEAAIEKLGFIPNDSARALRQNQTRLIGVVVPTLSYALYAEFYARLQEALAKHGFFALLATSEYDLHVEAEQAIRLIRQGAQGLVLVGKVREKRLFDFLAASRVPTVNTYVVDPTDNTNNVGFDNVKAIESAVNHLIALGHRRIAMLSGITTRRNDRALARRRGYEAAMQRNGLETKGWVEEAPYTIAGGRSALRTMLDRALEPTALVCGSDMLAIGALQECKTRSIGVPRDLSIMGFDDLEIAAHLDPPLSTVEVPSREMGIAAAECIVAHCLGTQLPSRTVFETSLVIRSTTARPRAPSR